MYLPDDVKLTSLSRDFLITVKNNKYNKNDIFIYLGIRSDKSGEVCSNV
jgi:hypothetical protein